MLGVMRENVELANFIVNLIRTVHDGTMVTVNVADPNGRIIMPGPNQAVVKGRRFFVGVYSPSGYYARAVNISSSTNQQVFRIYHPKATPRPFVHRQ